MTVSWHSSNVYPWASFCSLVKYANVDFLVLKIHCSYVRGYLRGYCRVGICDHSVLFSLQFIWGLWLFQNKEFKNPEKKSSLCVLKAQSPTTHLYMLTQTFLHFPSGCDLVILSAFWGEWVYHFCYRTVLSPHQTSMRYLFITTHPSTHIYNVK